MTEYIAEHAGDNYTKHMEEDDYRTLVLRDDWGMASYLFDDGTEEE